MKSLTILAMLLCLLGCQDKNAQSQKPMYGDLPKALDLLDADGREGAYVIAEDPENQNYVQLGIMDNDWIHFDITSYIDETDNFEPEQEWEIVTELPEIVGAKRRHYIEVSRATKLWQFLTDGGFDPYYFRSVYERSSKPVAATESICFNVPRSYRDRCLLAASKTFEIVHGYPPPARMEFTSDQTSWARPPENNGEQDGADQPATAPESKAE